MDFQQLNESEQHEVADLNLVNVKHQSFAATKAKMLKYSIAINQELRNRHDSHLPEKLSLVPPQKLQALAYKTMDQRIYIGATIVMYIIEITMSIIVTDLGAVYGFVGTLSATSLCYFIPSILFIKAYNEYATEHFKRDHKYWYIVSIINLIFGFFLTAVFLYSNILSLQKDE